MKALHSFRLWTLLYPHFHSKRDYNILISTRTDLRISLLYTVVQEKKKEISNGQQGFGCDCWPRESSISIPLDVSDGAEAWGQASCAQQGWAEISDCLQEFYYICERQLQVCQNCPLVSKSNVDWSSAGVLTRLVKRLCLCAGLRGQRSI